MRQDARRARVRIMQNTDPGQPKPPPPEIVVVSGLPRSGTSMMMRMLAAGGMPLFTDGARAADGDNPLGYFEHEAVRRLREDASWVPAAAGKAVKVVSFLLPALPDGFLYRVILMRRPLGEVIASQRRMLERRGAPVADPEAGDARMAALCRQHLAWTEQWLETRPGMRTLAVDYAETLAAPADAARRVAAFLGGGGLDQAAMAAAVDPALRRARGGQ